MEKMEFSKSLIVGKRALDFIASLLGLIFLLPLFVVVAVCIKMDSKGPVFHRGWRVGKNGKLFRIFKFRTMVVGAEKMGTALTTEDDPRLTRCGAFLRRYKIDELPQLINVLLGQMSLVGPRPESPCYVEKFNDIEKKVLLSVKPGITDLASIRFHNYESILAKVKDPEKFYLDHIRPEKSRLQLEYIRNMSIKKDLNIIFKTVKAVYSPHKSEYYGDEYSMPVLKHLYYTESTRLSSSYKQK